jgi:hypothetical protein
MLKVFIYLFIYSFLVTDDLKPVTKHNLSFQRFQSNSVTLLSMDEKICESSSCQWMKIYMDEKDM